MKSYSFALDGLQAMQYFLWEYVWKSVRNYMEVREDILRYVKKKQNKTKNK